jgi:hypothetical protein
MQGILYLNAYGTCEYLLIYIYFIVQSVLVARPPSDTVRGSSIRQPSENFSVTTSFFQLSR